MKMKKLTSLALALTMVCSLALPARAEQGGKLVRPAPVETPAPEPTPTPVVRSEGEDYFDTVGHYAAWAVKTWSDYGVLKGYEDGAFRPDGTITRAELATVLDRVMGYQETVKNVYIDLPTGQWYTDCLLRLAKQGIFNGDESRKMNPEAPITRQETFAAMARALSLKESDKAPGFKDDGEISDWAKGYVSAMKKAGYIQGDQRGNIRPGDSITRAEVVTILNKMAAAFINKDGTYSKDCKGNLFVNAHDVWLKDMSVDGDLIVTDGVADGDVYLERVTVKGDIVLRGCGENSFHILPGTDVGTIIVTKTTGGVIRLVNESGKTIPMIYVNDGKAGVVLDGDELGDVVIACDAPVSIKSKKVKTVSVVADAKVTVEKGTTVSKVEVGKTAKNAALTVSGKVSKLTNDAKIKVEKKSGGSVGGGTVISSSGGGSSSTATPPPATSADPAPSESVKPTDSPSPSESVKPTDSPSPSESVKPTDSPSPSESVKPTDSPSPSESAEPTNSPEPTEEPTPVEIAEVTLQLLPPAFGNIPDAADVLGVGYTAETEWFNADGSAPSYRWKASGAEKDTFTADQAYKAVVTLSPMSDRKFVENLKVKVTDGNGNNFTPASSAKSGSGWMVTIEYDKTEKVDSYIYGLKLYGDSQVGIKKSAKITANYGDYFLVDPATHAFQWYQCDAQGENRTPVGTGKEYTPNTQTLGTFYYVFVVTVEETTYTSGVWELEVQDQITEDDVPMPVLGDITLHEPDPNNVWIGGVEYQRMTIDVSNLVSHKDVKYEVESGGIYNSYEDEHGEQKPYIIHMSSIFPLEIKDGEGTIEVYIANTYTFAEILKNRGQLQNIDISALTVEIVPVCNGKELKDKRVVKNYNAWRMEDQSWADWQVNYLLVGADFDFSTLPEEVEEWKTGQEYRPNITEDIKYVIHGGSGRFERVSKKEDGAWDYENFEPIRIIPGMYRYGKVDYLKANAGYTGSFWYGETDWNGNDNFTVDSGWLSDMNEGKLDKVEIKIVFIAGETKNNAYVYSVELDEDNIIIMPDNI